LKKAKQGIIKDSGIAILTPYKAQKKLMEDLLNENQLNVTVCTINESQGDQITVVLSFAVTSSI